MAQSALEALSADYFLQSRREDLPDVRYGYAYTGVYADDAVEPVCLTLLQLGVRARLHLVVHDATAAFAINTDRPMGHVLGEYFPGLRSISGRAFSRVEAGRLLEPRRLARFSLPRLPGVTSSHGSPLPMPVLDDVDGPVMNLGDVLSPLTGVPLAPARIPLARLARGTLVAGTTGSGKTNTVLRMIDEVKDTAWVLALDVKQEYRALHKTLDAKVYGFTGQNLLTHNLLKPVGRPEQWAKEFAAILSEVIHRHSPAVGSKDVVTQELDRLYRERGVYEGNHDYPHIGDLLSALEARQRQPSSREAGWISSALRVLRSLMVGSTRSAFCVRQGLALERLLDGVTVVELDGIGDPAATSLLASVLLQKIRNHHLGQPEQTSLRGLIVVEEAQHLLAQGSEATSVLATTCREIRSTGIGLVYVTQMPSEFSKHALANVNTLVVHRLLHPPDRSLVARMMDLESEQRRVFAHLDPGRCVLHAGQPLLVQVPLQERPHVRDEELPVVRVPREAIATDFARRTDVQNRAIDLPPRHWRILEAITTGKAAHPSAIRDELGISYRDVSAGLGSLIRRGLVRYCPAKGEGRGRPRLVHFPTPAGAEAYRARHGHYADHKGKATRRHADVVADVVKRLGISRLPHRRFDILFREDDREVAVEVETGVNNDEQLLANIVKSLEFQGEARFVCVDGRTRNRVLQVAAKYCFDRRVACTVHAGVVDELPNWTTFRLQPAGVKPTERAS